MQEISNKQFFKNYAFFIIILLVVFSILSYFIFAARKSWNKNLAVTVQKVLEEKETARWKVGDNIQITKPITVNCAAYEILDTSDNITKYAVIIRIITYYGPVPAVYVYNPETKKTDFIGYASLHGRIRTQIMNNKSDKKREYWQEKIPEIIKL